MSAEISAEMSAEMGAAVPNHRRTKPGGFKAVSPTNGAVGPTSQIPGLSQSADDKAPAERTGGRRVGIFATDSEYVKLAKAGGQKGLLCHVPVEDQIVVEAPKTPYNPPEWFGGPESKSGSKVTSPNGHAKAAFAAMQPLAAPFGTDNGSVWIETDQVLSPDSLGSQIDSLTIAELQVQAKYKRTSYDKKAAPVSMSKLLSFGYIEDENKSPNDDDASSVTTEQTSTIATEDVDDLE